MTKKEENLLLFLGIGVAAVLLWPTQKAGLYASGQKPEYTNLLMNLINPNNSKSTDQLKAEQNAPVYQLNYSNDENYQYGS